MEESKRRDGVVEAEDARSVDRIASFSDAVFAVAITLLVLNIDVPVIPAGKSVNTELPSELLALGPKFWAFVLSFVIIGFFWLSHHMMFRHIKRYTGWFIWLNLLLLMCIVFMPFSTSLMSEYGDSRVAVMFYAGSWAASSIVMALMWSYATGNRRLVAEDYDVMRGRHATLAFLNTALIFLISMPIALVSASAATYFWILLFPTHVFIQRFHNKEPDRAHK